MIESQGNSILRRCCRSALVVSFSALLFFGCSSTLGPQTLQASLGNNPAKLNTPSTPSAPLTSGPQGFGNPAAEDEIPQIQAPLGRYILGPGDVINVTVWGHPELSGKRVIGPDGEVQVPFVGSFRVAGVDADDASSKLTSALREDYLNTAVSVTVDSYNSNQIVVLGHVARPGILIFPGDPTLLEALARAGAGPKGDEGGMPIRCAIVRGRDRIMWVDLRPLVKGTDLSLNIPLQRNALVFV